MSEGKIALITGGAGNLGRAVVQRFLEDGYSVLVPWHSREKYDSLRGDLDPGMAKRVEGIEADLTEEGDVSRVMQHLRENLGNPSVLLNLVGGFAFGAKVWEMDLGTWQKMLTLNLTTAFLCCKHTIPLMREMGGGAIVNVSSKACEDLQAGASAYAVSKGGIITLTRCLREELKGTGITVNAIMPSIIDTPVTREIMPGGDPEKWVRPTEIAEALVSLCDGRWEALSGSVLRFFGEL